MLKIFPLAAAFFLIPYLAQADCNQNSSLNFVARDPSGAFIPNARVEVYKQAPDANGQPKPTSRVASATANATLGIAQLNWRNSLATDTYAIKVQTVSKEAASFWYYNFSIACGQTISLEKTLSGILFILHDADGNLLKNTNFNIYSQLYDASGNPLKEKKESLASLNSGLNGSAKIYLPQGSVRSLDGAKSDHYALELTRANVKFNFYNMSVYDEQLTTVNYYSSALRVRLQDTLGATFPAGTKVEVFRQEVGLDNEHKKGEKVGEFLISDDGYGTIEVVAGLYVLGVKGQNSQYQYFWDVEAKDGRATEYSLTSNTGWVSDGTCQENSNLYLTLRNAKGELAPGLKYELYEQQPDSNGLPSVTNKIAGGTVNNSARATITFKPDPRKTYALKVWDKNANLGDFWFFDAVKFVCGYNRYVTKNVSVLKIILRDGQGKLKKNYNFSLYVQRYDADLNPIYDDSDLIFSSKTGNGGYALAYVAPYNPYRPSQSGLYALSAKDSNNNLTSVYNIRIPQDKDYSFQYAFSSLSGELRDARKKLLANREIRVYEQQGSGSDRSLGRLLYKVNTSASGRFQLEYPAGTYALAVLDDLKKENVFWNVTIKTGKNSTQKLLTNLTKFSLADAQGEGIPKDASLKLYSVSSDDNVNYYRDAEIGIVKLAANKTATISLSAGTYLVAYMGKNNKEYGRVFKAVNGQLATVLVTVNRKNLINPDKAIKIVK